MSLEQIEDLQNDRGQNDRKMLDLFIILPSIILQTSLAAATTR